MKKSIILCSLLLIFVLSFEIEEEQKEYEDYFKQNCNQLTQNCGPCQITTKWVNRHCQPDYTGCIIYDKKNNCSKFGFGLDNLTGNGTLNCKHYYDDGKCQTCFEDFTLNDTTGICMADNCQEIEPMRGACEFKIESPTMTSSRCNKDFKQNGYNCIHHQIQIPTGCFILNTSNLNNYSGDMNLKCLYCYNGYKCMNSALYEL